MKKKTENILTIIHILAWVTFVGILVKTGAVVVAFIVSLFYPDAAKNMYQGLTLSDLRTLGFWHYAGMVSFIVTLSSLKAYIAYLVIRISQKINVSRPFEEPMSLLISKVSEIALSAGIVALVADSYFQQLMKRGIAPQQAWGSGEFLFLAGVIFVIAQVFKKGVELQSENELTI